jgi:hypothetical protein
VRLAEHEREGDNKELVTLVVTDVQDPVSPVFETALIGKALHDAGRMIARLGKIIHHGASAIDEYLLRVGAVEIDLGHVQSPLNGMGISERLASLESSRRGHEDEGGDAAAIWNHIQVAKKGNRII